VLSCEIGGANGLEPLCIGARLGLPVIDADFMGRAFPELQARPLMVSSAPQALPTTIVALAGHA
jgi:DUF917 family protein